MRVPSRLTRSLGWLLAVVAIAGTLAVAAQQVATARAFREEKFWLAGVSNFGRMNERLFRGAQPTSEGFANLRRVGIDTIVRLSLGEDGAAREQEEVEQIGMQFVAIPWSTQDSPTPEQVRAFFEVFDDPAHARVFVHCKAGADRTGVMIALYRINIDRWPVSRALDEMNAFHHHPIFLPHLQAFVRAFPVMPPGLPAPATKLSER
jgi:protein tyrosine/serine phosphatase